MRFLAIHLNGSICYGYTWIVRYSDDFVLFNLIIAIVIVSEITNIWVYYFVYSDVPN